MSHWKLTFNSQSEYEVVFRLDVPCKLTYCQSLHCGFRLIFHFFRNHKFVQIERFYSLSQHVCAVCVANDVRFTYCDRCITLRAVLGHPLLDDAFHLLFHCNFFLILQKPVSHHLKAGLNALSQTGLIILLEYSAH